MLRLEESLSTEAYTRIYNDPAGDNFRHYRGSDLDDAETSILDRYKYYNGTEGNSRSSEDTGERYSTSSRSTPDVEDLNQDYTMNENRKVFSV